MMLRCIYPKIHQKINATWLTITKPSQHVAEILYLSVEFVTHLILLVLATIALVKIDELSFIGKPRSIDDLLIYLAFTGSLMYNIALVNSSVFVFSSSSDYCMKVEVMRIVQSLCAILQQIIQVGVGEE